MKITLKVPKSAVSSREGRLVEWYVDDGATVEAGAPIYAIELEKAALDIEAPFRGVVRHLATVDEVYAVGDPIAELTRQD
ncbi:MAG: lipoyl domain-containing protein [Pseudomonadota bacterium]